MEEDLLRRGGGWMRNGEGDKREGVLGQRVRGRGE